MKNLLIWQYDNLSEQFCINVAHSQKTKSNWKLVNRNKADDALNTKLSNLDTHFSIMTTYVHASKKKKKKKKKNLFVKFCNNINNNKKYIHWHIARGYTPIISGRPWQIIRNMKAILTEQTNKQLIFATVTVLV